MNHLRRRLLTLPILFLATFLITAGLPLWLLLAWVSGLLIQGARAAPRVLLFLTAFLWCEVIGVLASAWLWLRHGWRHDAASRQQFLEANFRLQFWWAERLKRAAAWLFRLRFSVEGAENLDGDGVIMLPRHCSIGDTLIPIVFYCAARDRRLRYVLKRELLFDPCLDIVGNRLPNYFVDRAAQDTGREVDGIKALAAGLPADQGVLIYPEGTRFSAAKRQTLLARLQTRDPELATRAAAWDRLLPPRSAGPVGLLLANPGRDLVFCAHTGFEGSASFTTLFNGSWLDTEVRVKFWRVPFADLPRDAPGLKVFLHAQWDRMNDEVTRLQDGFSGQPGQA
ncbi:MAG: 1-acyl-sn-glycerol-3-phosphate acyltransferase [Gammaproteobacteria bacterium]|nr:1-acyl-sn-glycerol-3-phosphate acyltransferase [Gammaproteobacteria bacterium]